MALADDLWLARTSSPIKAWPTRQAVQAMGKTRRGRKTKLMALTDGKGALMSFIFVEGPAYQGKHVRALLPKGCKWQVVGDKEFDSDKLRKELESLGHQTCFPGKKTLPQGGLQQETLSPEVSRGEFLLSNQALGLPVTAT